MLTSLYNNYKVNLVENLEDLELMHSRFNDKAPIGIDTETEGLDYVNHSVVGVCISCGSSFATTSYEGYYIPIRHYGYVNNLPVDKVIAVVQDAFDHYRTIFWNRNFDLSMLEKDGLVVPFNNHSMDAQILGHLIKSEAYPALKEYAKTYLKFEVMEFSTNGAKDHNFGTTDPLVSYRYGAQDPLITALLARKLWTDFPYIHKIFPIDNKSAEAMRKFSMKAVIPLNFDVIQRELDKVVAELSSVKQQIFSLCGYEFRLTAPQDKADALSRFVSLTQKTASGRYAVSDDVLKKIDHPLARLFQRYNKLEKYRGTYLAKMLEYPKEGIHISYGTVTAATGRLSSGGQRGNSYFADFNIQNVPKVEVMRYVHTDKDLGYVINDESEGALCMMKVKGGLRDAFVCPSDEYVWLSADYSAEEMRVMANLSDEPNMIEPLLQGYDIHNYIAQKMFGFVDKHHRTKVKVLNFAVGYGAGPNTIAEKLGIPVPEARELLDHYNKTLPALTRWKEGMKKEARKKGIVYTYFGRPREMAHFYNCSDNGMHAFGDRTAVNSPVQGFGGDLIRIDHCKLLQKFVEDPEFAANCLYANTVHDEINLYVSRSYVQKAFKTLTNIMDFHPSNFKVGIECSPSVGTCWGTLCEADTITENNHIIINREKCEPLDGETEEQMFAKIDAWESQEGY